MDARFLFSICSFSTSDMADIFGEGAGEGEGDGAGVVGSVIACTGVATDADAGAGADARAGAGEGACLGVVGAETLSCVCRGVGGGVSA